MNKEILLWLLKTKTLAIYFTKKDNTKRVMICTLRKSSIPEVENTREKPEGLITVWDIEKKGWRSFYINSIFKVQVLAWTNIYNV